MAKLTYIGRPVVHEPWIAELGSELAQAGLAGAVDLLPPEQLRSETLSRREVNSSRQMGPEEITLLGKGMDLLRLVQPRRTITETVAIFVHKKNILLGLEPTTILEEGRDMSFNLAQEVPGIHPANITKDFKFSVRLGTMLRFSGQLYREVGACLTDNAMPASVRLTKLEAGIKTNQGKHVRR